MLESAKDVEAVSEAARALCSALQRRDHAGFQAQLQQSLSAVSARTTKAKMNSEGTTPPPREAPFHTFLHGLLLGSVPGALGFVSTEVPSAQGDADLILFLKEQPEQGLPSAVWILEVGLGATDRELSAKLAQGQSYAEQHASNEVLVCAVLVGKALKADKADVGVRFAWARRGAGEQVWAAL